MATRIIVHPWRSLQDLLDVRGGLYARARQHDESSEDYNGTTDDTDVKSRAAEQRLAINIVATWEYRGAVPHPIVATASLADALLTYRDFNEEVDSSEDEQQQQQQQLASRGHKGGHKRLPPFAARALFATAIARFVTGYCDVGHVSSGGSGTSSTAKKSMYEVAAEINMPEDFVAMRHEITHGTLPQVAEMRGVAERALEWLWHGYWSKLEDEYTERVATAPLPVAARQELQALLKRLLKLRKDHIKSRAKLFPPEIYAHITGVVRNRVDAGADAIANIMVADRLLLPSSNKTQDAQPNMKAAFLIWDAPLDHLMGSLPGLHVRLQSELQTQLLKGDSGPREAITSWLVHLISHAWSSLHHTDQQNAIDDLMEFCLLNPCSSTATLSSRLNDAQAEHSPNHWSTLIDASSKAAQCREIVEDTDMDIDSTLDSCDEMSAPIEGEGGWKPLRGIWTPRPIGVLHQDVR